MPKKTTGKTTKQLHVVKLCPLMSRKVTFMSFGEEGTKFVRQECVGDDCELWDKGAQHCSLRRRVVD